MDIFGKFSIDDNDLGIRLTKIRYEIFTLIQLHRPDYVIFEDIQLQNNVANNVQTFKALAAVYGVISELLTSLEIPHSSVLASVWKSQLGIKGKNRQEQKKNSQWRAINVYNINPTQDEADAINIGDYYISTEQSAW